MRNRVCVPVRLFRAVVPAIPNGSGQGACCCKVELARVLAPWGEWCSVCKQAYNCLFDASTQAVQPWFHGYQSREVSSKLLSDAPLGTQTVPPDENALIVAAHGETTENDCRIVGGTPFLVFAVAGSYVLRYSIRNVGCIVLSFAAEDGSARVIRNCLVYNHGTVSGPALPHSSVGLSQSM
jgi:hypothetical protein